jgi:hypothetical protein
MREDALQGVVAKILPEFVQLVFADGLTTEISHADYLATLSASLSVADEGGQSFWLPPNTLMFQKSATQIKVAMMYPEGVYDINYAGDSRPRIMPNLVITVTAKRHTDKVYTIAPDDVFFLATKYTPESIPRSSFPAAGSAGFRTAPTTNIYNTGRMCFGNNPWLKEVVLPDLRPLHSFFYTFTNSPFNNDLGVNSLSGDGRSYSVSSWFNLLAEIAAKPNKSQVVFPYHLIGL